MSRYTDLCRDCHLCRRADMSGEPDIARVSDLCRNNHVSRHADMRDGDMPWIRDLQGNRNMWA